MRRGPPPSTTAQLAQPRAGAGLAEGHYHSAAPQHRPSTCKLRNCSRGNATGASGLSGQMPESALVARLREGQCHFTAMVVYGSSELGNCARGMPPLGSGAPRLLNLPARPVTHPPAPALRLHPLHATSLLLCQHYLTTCLRVPLLCRAAPLGGLPARTPGCPRHASGTPAAHRLSSSNRQAGIEKGKPEGPVRGPATLVQCSPRPGTERRRRLPSRGPAGADGAPDLGAANS